MIGELPYTNTYPKSQTVIRHGIQYRTNDQGWRTHNHSSDKGSGNMFLGCSFTFGEGVALEDTWAHHVWKAHGTRCFWNLAVAGSGIDTMSRLFWHWAPLLKPQNVYVLNLFEPRREFATDEGFHCVSSYTEDAHDRESVKRYFHWSREQLIHGVRCRSWISHVASQLGISVTWVDDYKIAPSDKKGADELHPSAEWHANLARVVIDGMES